MGLEHLSGKHILGPFENAIDGLHSSVLMMASLVERGLQNVEHALFERSDELANQVIADDEEIDALEIQIDREGIDLMMRFQPVASDLRHVVAAMKMSVNIERIGDETVTIARRTRKLCKHPLLAQGEILRPLFADAGGMFRDAIRCYTEGVVDLARGMKARDRELDSKNQEVLDVMTACMAEDASQLQNYLNYIFIARALERIGDHATNICEDVVYLYEAEDIRHKKPGARNLEGTLEESDHEL